MVVCEKYDGDEIKVKIYFYITRQYIFWKSLFYIIICLNISIILQLKKYISQQNLRKNNE